MKGSGLVVLGALAVGAYFLLSKNQGDGGTGGSLNIPALFGTGNVGGDPVVSQPAQPAQPAQTNQPFVPSQKILDAMRGVIQPATTVYGGSSPQAAAELSLIQKKGFSTAGLSSSYDPSTNTAYTFAPETATVEKKLISRQGFDTTGLQGSFDPSSGKITTFGGTGTVSYAAAPVTSKKSSISSSSSSFSNPSVGQHYGGFGVTYIGKNSSGGRVFK